MAQNIFTFMNNFSRLKILVIGEAMLDRYLKGITNRLSQEAPVQVVRVEEKEDIPGGAANTAANIRSLGAEPILLSVIGDDEEGSWLREALGTFGISDQYIVAEHGRQTLAKQRLLANSQMMIRFDQGSTEAISEHSEKTLVEAINVLAPNIDAIIVSDYGYGVVTPAIQKALLKVQKKNPRILVVDAKEYQPYRKLHVTAIKPNYAEAMKVLHLEPKEDSKERVEQVSKYGPKLLEIANTQVAAVTLDQDGALIFERGHPCYRIYARPAEHNRVTGAGDTYMSALALALAAGAPTTTAAEIASAASAIVVEKDGTSTCYVEELRTYFSGDEKLITDNFNMTAWIEAYRKKGKRIVFTNGCFDILHSGHIQYLNKAKAQGDVLIVGINDDEGVRRIKGAGRPINPLEDRAQVLAALSCVDHIIPFEEDIPYNLINLIKPDVFAKGGDYSRDKLPEAELVEQLGGKIAILPYVEDHSTTGIIERIRKTNAREIESKTLIGKKALDKGQVKNEKLRMK